jgi:hypothetical protein
MERSGSILHTQTAFPFGASGVHQNALQFCLSFELADIFFQEFEKEFGSFDTQNGQIRVRTHNGCRVPDIRADVNESATRIFPLHGRSETADVLAVVGQLITDLRKPMVVREIQLEAMQLNACHAL